MSYLFLFIVAFVSATLLPFGSEGYLLFLLQQDLLAWLLIVAASLGNTLGSCVNYFLGYKGEAYLVKKNLIQKQKIKKAQIIFSKYGSISLLFSWAPIIGDPLTFFAGILRYRFFYFFCIVACAKTARYCVVYFLFS